MAKEAFLEEEGFPWTLEDGEDQHGGKEVLLAKLMVVSHERRQERARWHWREDI